jgi:predicted nicotinamide N-methyase
VWWRAGAQELHFKTLAYTPAAALGHLDTVERVATWRERPGGGSDGDGDGDGDGARERLDACTRLITLRVSSNYFAGDTGCRDWDAGTYLAELALSWPRLFAGRRVLELGAGVGLSAMCMLRHCAPARLTLTDGDATTLANLEHNLHLNGCAPTPPPEAAEQRPDGPTQAVGAATRVAGTVGHTVLECRRLLWGEGDATELHALRAEVVVGADIVYARTSRPIRFSDVRCITTGSGASVLTPRHSLQVSLCERRAWVCRYDPTSVPPLVSTLRTLLCAPPADEPPPYALICTTMRQERTLETFLAAVVAAGLSATDRTAALSPTRTFHYHSHVRRDEVRVHLLRAA